MTPLFNRKRYRYFTQSDFDNCTPPCKISDMDHGVMVMFDRARDLAGIPFFVNSAYRTVEHELSRGRSGDSAHTTGKAMDIRANASRNRFLIVDALLKVGFNRIGIARTFIHADYDQTKDDRVIWLYS